MDFRRLTAKQRFCRFINMEDPLVRAGKLSNMQALAQLEQLVGKHAELLRACFNYYAMLGAWGGRGTGWETGRGKGGKNVGGPAQWGGKGGRRGTGGETGGGKRGTNMQGSTPPLTPRPPAPRA